MSVTLCEVRRGAYYDSVVLMQLQRALSELPGVHDAGVVMATAANLDLLDEMDLLTPEAREAGPDDLLLTVKAEGEAQAGSALAQVDELLKKRRSAAGQSFQPRSLASANKALPQAEWVLISVPGRYAAPVAQEALDAGKHVFLYSDNVPLREEIELKQVARRKGLLLMGPDCGTAIVNGIGLGFANRTRRGHIGLIAASGTGLQAVVSEIQQLGSGVSQAIGTGGRDLSKEVSAMTTLRALALLAADDQTKVIVLVSKPPAPEVATRVLARAREVGKPVVVYFMGQPTTVRRLGRVHFAFNLSDTAELAVKLEEDVLESEESEVMFRNLAGKCMRGLFSGGTLAYEILLGLQSFVAPLFSNVPLRDEQRLENPMRSRGHTIIDMGADEFTQGRLHPMMDNALRIRRMQQETADPDVGLVLIDVVLGEGAHPDPAAELAPAIADAVEQQVDVAVLLVGTDDDPQELARQHAELSQAGATVFRRGVDLVKAVAYSVIPGAEADNSAPISADTFTRPLAAINVGLESFYDSVKGQGAEAIHVAWRPPAGGNEKMMALLAQLKSK